MALDRFQTLIFDLDDTLIPTSEILIPQAVRQVFKILAEHGLDWDFKAFEEYRKKHLDQCSHREIIKNIIEENKLSPKSHIFESCLNAFYKVELPPRIPLLPEAQRTLQYLRPRYQLLLLTAGDERTQKEKIIRAGLENLFHEVKIVGSLEKKDKKESIANWIKEKKINPQSTLSIGNRLKDEIRVSKTLGLSTCWFKYGDHAAEVPKDIYETPDYEVHHYSDLVTQCQL